MKSYKDLEIYQLSFDLAVEVHKLTLKLPEYERYEEGRQIRKSSKSITANIVEGYGRNRYKADFIKFLTYSHASCAETIGHLLFIEALHPKIKLASKLLIDYDKLGRKINRYIQYVKKNWR
ncbi:MAG: four helix bundle protein [Candidatus Cloacimonetes bacterium]|nr:four helix bundle protein [Candidatus Cloacimonadota bacterium]